MLHRGDQRTFSVLGTGHRTLYRGIPVVDGGEDVNVINDEPWFCLVDVCAVLEIKNSRHLAANQLDEKGVAKSYTLTQGGEQEITFINEPNLYRVIFRSNKPEAKAFQDWVFNDVLPAIRQHGAYVQPAPPVPTRTREPISPAKYYELKSLVHDISGCCHWHDKAHNAVWARIRKDCDADSVLRLPVESFDYARDLLKEILGQAKLYFNDRLRRDEVFIEEVIRRGSKLQLVLPLLPAANE